MWFFIILFVVLVGGGWLLGKSLANLLFPTEKEKSNVFIDNSVHHHHHHHEHKSISIIDEVTKEEIIVYQKSINSKNDL